MEGFEEPVIEPGMEGGGGEGFPVPVEETALQKVWRFLLGLLGLDSAPPSNSDPGIVPGPVPGIEEPLPGPKPGTGKG
jgi:hypothetical protein